MAFNRFKTMLRIEVERSFPVQHRGRPPSLTSDEAYENILKVTRTGMQWRQLQPRNVSFITVFKTMHKWFAADLFRIVYRSSSGRLSTNSVRVCGGISRVFFTRYMVKLQRIGTASSKYATSRSG